MIIKQAHLVVWVLLNFFTSAVAALAQDAAKVEAGLQVYTENCQGCHGERLISPGAAFDLRRLNADERPRFDKAMSEGRGQMPSWEGILTPEQYDQLWAYIRSRALN